MALRELALPREGLDTAVEAVLAGSFWNPRKVDKAGLQLLLTSAYDGAPPS